MDQGSGIFQVAIDFKQSHLFFPHIIQWILLGLLVLIALVHGREIVHNARARLGTASADRAPFDVLRVVGTLVLVVVYFIAMERFGALFPNEGFGFLFMSMPFMFLLSLLYVHEPNLKKVTWLTAVSIIAPLVAWYVLGRLFWITLP